jgi:anti-sigma-K factor RskA
MLRESCSPYQEDLPAYSLGVLDAGDIDALESHIQACKDCQAELADFRKIAAGLMHSIPPRMPPQSLRRTLITRLQTHQNRPPNLLSRLANGFSPGQFVTTTVLLVLLLLNLSSAREIRDLQERQSAMAERLSTYHAAIALLAYPNTQAHIVKADTQDLTGSMLVDKERPIAVLFLWNLPELEPGKVYQVWLINARGERLDGGLFTPDRWQNYTTAFIESPVPLGEFIGIGVTIEPSGGSDQPTGLRILTVDL